MVVGQRHQADPGIGQGVQVLGFSFQVNGLFRVFLPPLAHRGFQVGHHQIRIVKNGLAGLKRPWIAFFLKELPHVTAQIDIPHESQPNMAGSGGMGRMVVLG